MYIYVYIYIGRPKWEKKMLYSILLFEDPGWETLQNLEYRNFYHFRCSRVLQTLWPPFPLHSKYSMATWLRICKEAIPKRLGDMSELNTLTTD